MVKVRDDKYILENGQIDLEAWLAHLAEKSIYQQDIYLIRHACHLSQLAVPVTAVNGRPSHLQTGLAIADTLAQLELDPKTLAAAIIYSCYQYADISILDIAEELHPEVAKLVTGVEHMDAISYLGQSNTVFSGSKIDNIRKMLIAMVDDVRVVLIKLAERLCLLRQCAHLSEEARKSVAQETMDIYAPLANRLGIGHIKWEMEDLAFRQLDKEQYKTIARGLKERRVERDKFISEIVTQLKSEIEKTDIQDAKVYGRSKHIRSIYNKMVRKQVPLEQIYDIQAVRVLVNTIEDCYAILSIIHSLWKQIPNEFDDYIANPKPNGYRSLHTAVKTQDGHIFEVQIRTREMHALAELGVASHWRYKEGAQQSAPSHEKKIEWLRDVLAWQHECTTQGTPIGEQNQAFLEDRIYVFTPKGDVIDLPKGATPLDFAYTIHTELGHRCRGAKINGEIVPLTHVLKSAEQVQLMTSKQGKPSRDWLNPHSGYITTARARAKIAHWFKYQDYDRNVELGKTLLEKEYKKQELQLINFDKIATDFHLPKNTDLFAALGAGDLSIGQVSHKIKTLTQTPAKLKQPVTIQPKSKSSQITIHGIGNFESHIAKCCKPLPGDLIIGYITLGRGISIHRQDCQNIQYESAHASDRFIEINWGSESKAHYSVDIQIIAEDHPLLIQHVTTLLTHEKVAITALTTMKDPLTTTVKLNLSINIDSLHSLEHVLALIRKNPEVREAKRFLITP